MRVCDSVMFSSVTETEDNECVTDNESNYSMMITEENVISQLGNLGLQQSSDFPFKKAHQYSESKSNLIFMNYVSISGISIKLKSDATPEDVMKLLKKWCLEGPYLITQSIFKCYTRNKNVSVSNTIEFDRDTWKQLAIIMKCALKDNEEDQKLITLSPMYRYYGDLFPDNGREENMIE